MKFRIPRFFKKINKGDSLSKYLVKNWGFSNSKTTRKNMQKNADHFKKVSSNVRSVNVLKTTDTDCDVVTLIDADGDKASLWLYADGSVQTITTY